MTTHFGFGAINELRDIVANGAKRVFLVTGAGSFESSGAQEIVNEVLANSSVTRFIHPGDYSRVEDVEKGIEEFKKQEYDLLLAIGGGRVIDIAKLIRFFYAREGTVNDFLSEPAIRPVSIEPPALVAIPTTAGAGSEATKTAVIYLNGVKHSVSDLSLLPDYAIVDPELTMNLPAGVAAATGMDALSQSIESYWSVRSTDESQAFSKEGILLALKHLKESVTKGTRAAREAMAKAALLSGQAINITTTTAPHAVSYPFTTMFGVPHGHAVALTLGDFFVYNAGVDQDDVVDPRGVEYVKQSITELNGLLGCPTDIASRSTLKTLMQEIGLETDIRKIGVTSEKQVDEIVERTNVERMSNNPRRVTADQLKQLLLGLMGEAGLP